MYQKQLRYKDSWVREQVKRMDCAACYKKGPSDPAHIKSVGSGGPDHPINLIPLCRSCHTMQHKIGIVTFLNKHPELRDRLLNCGWEIICGKLINSQLALFDRTEELDAVVY